MTGWISSRGADWVWVGLLLLVAAVPRLWRLGAQVVGGDEGHLIWGVLEGRFPQILYTYSVSDYSLPMAGFARLLLLATGMLDDAALRALPVGFGILLVMLPLLFRREITDCGVPWIWSALLAVSPLLVVYSRIARSYVPATALCMLVMLCLLAWMRQPRRWLGAVAAGAGALAIWFHPITLLLPPAAFATQWLLASGWRSAPGDRGGLFRWALAFGAASALFLVPGSISLMKSVAEKNQGGTIDEAPAAEALSLLVGHPSAMVAGLVLLVALGGAIRLTLRQRGLAVGTLVMVALQVALVLALAPTGIAGARIVARYLLPVWPWILLWVAEGLVGTLRGARGWWTRTPIEVPGAICLVGLLFAAGPLTKPESGFSSFLHQQDWIGFTRPWRSTSGLPMPGAYRSLGAASGAIIEFPMHDRWAQSIAVPNYQRVHRRPVLVSRPTFPWNHAALELSANVRPTPRAFLAAPAPVLVLIALLRPGWLAGVARRWLIFAELVVRVGNALVLSIVFIFVVIAVDWVMRRTGQDPLDRRSARRSSYWCHYPARQADLSHFECMA